MPGYESNLHRSRRLSRPRQLAKPVDYERPRLWMHEVHDRLSDQGLGFESELLGREPIEVEEMLEVEDDDGFRRGFDYRLEIAMFEGCRHPSIVAIVTPTCKVG